MIDSVQSSQGMFGMQRTPPAPLTDDQKTAVQSILSQYDPKNLSSSDAQSIFKSLREAGVGPSPDLRKTHRAAKTQPAPTARRLLRVIVATIIIAVAPAAPAAAPLPAGQA